MPDLIPDPAASRFSLFAVRKGNPQPLIQIDIPWEHLLDNIVTPYEAGELFFVDGAPVKATDVDRLKILLEGPNFGPVFRHLHTTLRMGDVKNREMIAKQYPVLMDALLREKCTDVTSQVITAFKTAVKPRLSDRLPDKKVLFDAAIKLLIEGTKAWAQH